MELGNRAENRSISYRQFDCDMARNDLNSKVYFKNMALIVKFTCSFNVTISDYWILLHIRGRDYV